jgi:transcriptional regulator with XRE-family HTH domain
MLHEDLHRQIGRQLRQRRKQLGLTQADLAEACGVGFQQIHNYEQGTSIAASKLVPLAAALDIGVEYFFETLGATQMPARSEAHQS